MGEGREQQALAVIRRCLEAPWAEHQKVWSVHMCVWGEVWVWLGGGVSVYVIYSIPSRSMEGVVCCHGWIHPRCRITLPSPIGREMVGRSRRRIVMISLLLPPCITLAGMRISTGNSASSPTSASAARWCVRYPISHSCLLGLIVDGGW